MFDYKVNLENTITPNPSFVYCVSNYEFGKDKKKKKCCKKYKKGKRCGSCPMNT